MEKIGTTLIIGNGFDINLGMDTSYKSFYHKLTATGFWAKHVQNTLLMYIKEKGERNNWYDFESIILDYAINSKFAKRLKVYESFGKKEDQFVKKIVGDANSGIKYLKKELVQFLTVAKPNYNIDASGYWMLAAILGAFGHNEVELADSLLKKKENNLTWHFPNNRVLSFNYINDPAYLSRYLQFFVNVKGPCSPPIGRDSENLANLFTFVHNSLDFTNRLNKKINIVFGTNDDNRIPKKLSFLRKSYWLPKGAKRQFNDILCNSNRIVIFGHSVHGIDYDYYRDFFERLRPEHKVYVIAKEKEDLEIIRSGIEKKGGKIDICYISVENSKAVDNGEFLNLCKEIASENIDEVVLKEIGFKKI